MTFFSGETSFGFRVGLGRHCIYAAERGAELVAGIDLSEKMIAEAKNKTHYSNVTYICYSIKIMVDQE